MSHFVPFNGRSVYFDHQEDFTGKPLIYTLRQRNLGAPLHCVWWKVILMTALQIINPHLPHLQDDQLLYSNLSIRSGLKR
jgi:hypothetical protein